MYIGKGKACGKKRNYFWPCVGGIVCKHVCPDLPVSQANTGPFPASVPPLCQSMHVYSGGNSYHSRDKGHAAARRTAYADFSYAKSSYDSLRFNNRSGVRLYQNSAAFRLYACHTAVCGRNHDRVSRKTLVLDCRGFASHDNRIVPAFSYAL